MLVKGEIDECTGAVVEPSVRLWGYTRRHGHGRWYVDKDTAESQCKRFNDGTLDGCTVYSEDFTLSRGTSTCAQVYRPTKSGGMYSIPLSNYIRNYLGKAASEN